MLYKFLKDGDNYTLEPERYFDFEATGLEKDLENMLAQNLSELYTENGGLMPIFQERKRQPEPDLVAIDADGNLVIFELKRGTVLGDTTIQVMRYSQDYADKSYSELEKIFQNYTGERVSLKEAHKEAFALDNPLPEDSFNKAHKLIIIGSYADTALVKAVEFWKDRIDIDYIPYRFYKINGEVYFEFFSKPYDNHITKGEVKGIMFDTNKSYDPDAIWDMLANNKVSAYGNVKNMVNSFNKNDYVFYYHPGFGVIAAGKIKDTAAHNNGDYEMYRKVELITPVINNNDEIRSVTVGEITKLLGKSFYYANTTKRPYLNQDESLKVLEVLKEKYKNC